MATLSTLRTLVRNQTLVETDDISDAELLVFLNQGLYELATRFKWPFLEATSTITTVQDQAGYTLPADYRGMIGITDADARRRLSHITATYYLEVFGGDPPNTDPAKWYYVLGGGTVYLVPTPETAEADAYNLYYRKGITALADDGDSPEYDVEFHHIISHYAIARVWEHEEDFEKANAADRKFDQGVELMARFYLKQVEDYPLTYGDGVRPAMQSTNTPFLDDGALAGW